MRGRHSSTLAAAPLLAAVIWLTTFVLVSAADTAAAAEVYDPLQEGFVERQLRVSGCRAGGRLRGCIETSLEAHIYVHLHMDAECSKEIPRQDGRRDNRGADLELPVSAS